MLRLPPLKSLQAFRCAAESLSFKSAAQQLHVTPTAISQQIKTLEQNLGMKLFKRLTREVVLTPEGKQLLPYISNAFVAMEEGITKLTLDPQPNRLMLTTLPSFASRWLVPRLGSFQQQVSDVNIHLSPGLGIAKFAGGDLDLAIRFGKGDYSGLTSRLLLKDYLLPVCHPDLINQDQPIKEQLLQLPLLEDDSLDMETIQPMFRKALDAQYQQAPSKLRVSDSSMLVEALLCGQGLALLRYSLVYDLLQRGQLICPIPIYLKSEFDFYLVAPQANFKRPKVIKFENWLRREIKVIEINWLAFHQSHLNNSQPLNAKNSEEASMRG
jgi:LysR family glycine cleavage system transcriptional activator